MVDSVCPYLYLYIKSDMNSRIAFKSRQFHHLSFCYCKEINVNSRVISNCASSQILQQIEQNNQNNQVSNSSSNHAALTGRTVQNMSQQQPQQTGGGTVLLSSSRSISLTADTPESREDEEVSCEAKEHSADDEGKLLKAWQCFPNQTIFLELRQFHNARAENGLCTTWTMFAFQRNFDSNS